MENVIRNANDIKRLSRAVAALTVAFLLIAAASLWLSVLRYQQAMDVAAKLEKASVVFPPIVETRYAETAYNLQAMMVHCIEKRDDAECEMAILDAEQVGFGCGLSFSCEWPRKELPETPVLGVLQDKPDATP